MPAAAASRRGWGATPMSLGIILTTVQFLFVVVIGLYFWNLLKNQQGTRVAVQRESRKEMERLATMRQVHLTEPLSERTRPHRFSDIIGQEDGAKALRAALCGPNPQHVLLYGPPGTGKTTAARLVLEEARNNPLSPFQPEAPFIELDATTARFDERGIADPLIGSVHDPIYQGAGPLGIAGIPQPKPGAVTKAHGGVLFIDEIGELHPIQLNKLLKVLEDRKVFFESAYYSSEDPNVPSHIRDMFENGLPADFRLVGATTRPPEELPPAIRSRCIEIFFRPLVPSEVAMIAANALRRAGYTAEPGAIECVRRFAGNGREAVNMIQLAVGLAQTEGRSVLYGRDVEWVAESGQYTPQIEPKIPAAAHVGVVNGLAVLGPNVGMLLTVEATAIPTTKGTGRVSVTGLVDEEELGQGGRRLRRKSTARNSLENVLVLLRQQARWDLDGFDLHINFLGGMPVDGPSAGLSMAIVLVSALTGVPVDHTVAMTGEVSIRGEVKPVGGTSAKIEAARRAGARRVLIPAENWQESYGAIPGISVIPVRDFTSALSLALIERERIVLPRIAAECPATARSVEVPAAAASAAEAEADRREEPRVPLVPLPAPTSWQPGM